MSSAYTQTVGVKSGKCAYNWVQKMHSVDNESSLVYKDRFKVTKGYIFSLIFSSFGKPYIHFRLT